MIISSILSKLPELYILEECDDYKLNDFQFGFIKGRRTSTDISLTNDVTSYFNFKGCPLFIFTLDAEGA